MISMPNSTSRPARRAALAFAVGLGSIGMSFAAAAPASATFPEIVIGPIGSQPNPEIVTGFNDRHDGKDRVVIVIGHFSNLQPNSVRLDSITICYNGPNVVTISPVINNTTGRQSSQWGYRVMGPGTCQTFPDGKTWTKQVDGLVMRVEPRVGDEMSNWSTIAGFHR